MVKIKIKELERECTLPNKWQDITLGQFIALPKVDADIVKILSVLTGVEYATIAKLNEFDLDDKVMPFLEFMKEPLTDANIPKHKTIKIKGVDYEIPTNLQGKYTLGQKINLQKRMIQAMNEDKSTINAVAYAVACYYQPIIDSAPADNDRAEELEKEILNCSVTEAYCVADFFFKKLIVSQIKRQPNLVFGRIKSKWLRASINWMYSRKSTRLTPWPEVIF